MSAYYNEHDKPVNCLPESATPALAEHGDPLAGAWRALDGNFSGLLHSDGLSVQVERDALKGYGNAINPQTAALFIRASLDSLITP